MACTVYELFDERLYLGSGLAAIDDEAVAPQLPVRFSGKRSFLSDHQIPHSLHAFRETQLGVVQAAKGLQIGAIVIGRRAWLGIFDRMKQAGRKGPVFLSDYDWTAGLLGHFLIG